MDPQPFVSYPAFEKDRQKMLGNFEVDLIDYPLASLISDLNTLPYVFTLQSCHGHFLHIDGPEILNFESLDSSENLLYRLAYIAFCIEDSPSGREFREKLIKIPSFTNPHNVQFCSAQWFWDQWPNSYALQVMVERFKDKDKTILDLHEAKIIKQTRDIFFDYMQSFTSRLLEE